MENKQDLALEIFNSGFNCSQAVFAVFCEGYGLNREMGFKAAAGLGGGCRFGEICGAVSGATLAIGLKYGQYIAGDADAKILCNSKTAEFVSKFQERNGLILCRDILGFDISTKEGLEKMHNPNRSKETCIAAIKCSVSLLEELGY